MCLFMASLNLLLAWMVTIESGKLFQSLMVFGKNEYLKQSLVVVGLLEALELVCREIRLAGWARLSRGMDRWPWRALWKMTNLLAILLLARGSHSSLLIISETAPSDLDLKSLKQNLVVLR